MYRNHKVMPQDLTTAFLFLSIVSTVGSSLLPPSNNNVYSNPVTNALFSLLPLAHSVVQCLTVGMLVLLQALFLSTKQAII